MRDGIYMILNKKSYEHLRWHILTYIIRIWNLNMEYNFNWTATVSMSNNNPLCQSAPLDHFRLQG